MDTVNIVNSMHVPQDTDHLEIGNITLPKMSITVKFTDLNLKKQRQG